ncbi:MAG: hypothetical protein QF752_12150 [Planctomycetota bacterium]|nr:hypothetical protein [Planctomycetota bacterium]
MSGRRGKGKFGLYPIFALICFGLILAGLPGCGVKKFSDMKKKAAALEQKNKEVEKEAQILRDQIEVVKQARIRAQNWQMHSYREGEILSLEGERYIRKIRFQRRGEEVTVTIFFDTSQPIKPHFKLYLLDKGARVCGEAEVRWRVYKLSDEHQHSTSQIQIDSGTLPEYYSLRHWGK